MPNEFRWTDSASTARTLALTEPVKWRQGSYGRLRSRYRSVGLDQRTVAVETLPDGAEIVTGRIRFIGGADLDDLIDMLEDGADGILLTYEDPNANIYPNLALEESGPLVAITPDADRFGFGEWEATVTLRATDGGSLRTLFP